MDIAARTDAAIDAAVDREAIRATLLRQRRQKRAVCTVGAAIVAHLRPHLDGKTTAEIVDACAVNLALPRAVLGAIDIDASTARLAVVSSGLLATLFDEFKGAATVEPPAAAADDGGGATLSADELRRVCSGDMRHVAALLGKAIREMLPADEPMDTFPIELRGGHRRLSVTLAYAPPEHAARVQRAHDRAYREIEAELDAAST